MVGDRVVVVLKHVTRLRDDPGAQLAPTDRARVLPGRDQVGDPTYTLDLQLMGTDGDHNTAGLKATAMRLVNAVPAVIAAPPGLVTALDLPLVTGKGLVPSLSSTTLPSHASSTRWTSLRRVDLPLGRRNLMPPSAGAAAFEEAEARRSDDSQDVRILR